MQIADLHAADQQRVEQAAAVLVEGFQEHWPHAWPTLEDAREEVEAALSAERICRVALEGDALLGWIGAIPTYDGNVWELHPLVVSPRAQGRGVGRRLVEDLEVQVAGRGGQTLWLGTDDEDNMTTLSGVDLYPNPLDHLARIQNLRGHPYEFYQKLGFVITGVMPDANGPGKPDIFMAKRVKRQ
jgi:aminoglycoside 6'-N-acetyltransferase I